MNRKWLIFCLGESGRNQERHCYEEECPSNHARRIPLGDLKAV